MKITKLELEKIIKEEIQSNMEQWLGDWKSTTQQA